MSLARRCFLAVMLLAVCTTSARADRGKDDATPAVPGFSRFHAVQPDAVGGLLLLGELNCVSCHQPAKEHDALIARKIAPILDTVGTRVRRGFLQKLLTDPAVAKPGTTMPDLLADDLDKDAKVNALVHFLASTGSVKHERPDKKHAKAGQALYHKVGCVTCHGTRDQIGKTNKLFDNAVPTWGLKSKYTIPSLRAFLENPLHVRPSGRMPGLMLTAKEAQEIAHYMLQDMKVPTLPANLNYFYYEGTWSKVPDFALLKPAAQGKSSGFEIGSRRPNNFAFRFEGFLQVAKDATYNFHLKSDDGSLLWIDDNLVVNNDGIHAPQSKSGNVKLSKGTHKVVVGFFQGGGGAELAVEFDGGGLSKRNLASHLTETPDPPKLAKDDPKDEDHFPLDATLIEQGRGLFGTLGCASCHQLNENKKPLTAPSAPALAKLKDAGGCLDAAPKKGLPKYPLSQAQRAALSAALKTLVSLEPPTPVQRVQRTFNVFNCYACHERGKIGGVEDATNPFFETVQKEMGDEGRVPPSLNGVGAKLNTAYLNKIFELGAHDRPYMHTRMPKFGGANVGHLVALFEGIDTMDPVAKVEFTDVVTKVKFQARNMVGANVFGCIKCHTFAGQKAEGVQGMDMILMPQRLRRDWFHNYMVDPNKFRPGTRMPSAWPKGESALANVFGGSTPQQLESIWLYLSDGPTVRPPIGLQKQSIPLVPLSEAIIYRNFIQGSGTRAIGVGYPEKVSLAFDANDVRLALIWHGAFIDAAKHWTDRGTGFEGPLGDEIITLPPGPAFANLQSDKDPWPTKPAKEQGFQFKGYRTSDDQRPTFLYTRANLQIEDFPNAILKKPNPVLQRTLTLVGGHENLYYRAAVADKIVSLGNDWYQVGDWKTRVEGATLRTSGTKMELLVPARDKFVQEYSW